LCRAAQGKKDRAYSASLDPRVEIYNQGINNFVAIGIKLDELGGQGRAEIMKCRTLKLWIVAVAALVVLIYPYLNPQAVRLRAATVQERRSQIKRDAEAKPVKQMPLRYAKFSHNILQHKQACSSCHRFPSSNWKAVRKAGEAFPDITDYPQHSSCLNCHRQQFFSGARPVICSICHLNPSPRDSRRQPFPNPPEIFAVSQKGRTATPEFAISFPHDKHLDLVGQLRPLFRREPGILLIRARLQPKSEPQAEESDPKSCAVCHKTYQPQGESDEEFVTKPPKELPEDAFWLKKGTFKTSPNHATCFTCHSQESGITPSPTDCSACHKLLPPSQQIQLKQAHDDYDPKLAAAMGITDKTSLELWSKRDTAKFRHEWIPHASLSCTACHNVVAINTLDRKTVVHVKSCGGEGSGCHIEKTNEGVLNLEVEKKQADPAFECGKCHISNDKRMAPKTHLNALAAAKSK
jgi:hypothetical protein